MPPKGAKLAPPPAVAAGPLSPAAQQQKANSAGIADYELPKTSLTKLAKGSIPDNVKMQQDVVLALMRSSTVFISYLAAAAHDQALARSGKSITASDVIKAITELDFGPSDNLVPLLEHELAAYRTHVQAVKAAKGKPAGPGRGKGRRSTNVNQEEDVDMDGGGAADGDEDGDEDEDGGDEDGPEGNEAGEEDEEIG
ncbi:hypothetical protein JCM24511_03218 [Saitozyma sp. JCM 24511]|nr:hypothetical protein JCM24511_03218 [Saitozyma sp. JCM 24511]